MPTCFDCGATVDPEDRFCGNCGIALGARSPAAAGAGEGAPGPGPAAVEPSPLLEAGGGAAEQGAAGVPSESTPLEQDDGEQFQATLIEFAQGGGQAAAAARAHEPVEERGPAEEAPAQSSNLSSDLHNSAAVVEPSGDSNAFGQAPDAAQSAPQSSASRPVNTGASDERRRSTGDLPSRHIAYGGRTAGSRRAASQLEPGTLLYGRYEIVKRIGGGGMGAVYYAKDRNLGDAPRAVKEMIQTHLDESQEKGVTAVGTMGYAPPELFSGKAEPRTDIYSLGATMFHLLTGSDPQDNPLLIFDFSKNPTPRQINPGVSNEMEWILMRAVEYEPERRFRSAAEMRDALAQHTERLRAGGVTYGAVRGAQSQQSASTLAVERVFCGFCGKSISSDDVFCPHCGARQPIAAASASLRAARATARLVVAGTTELDATFLLNKETNLVGRTDPQSNIFPDIDLSRFDPETKISRRHARIWREGDTFLLEDLGSVNGTVVNEAVRLGPRQPRPLANGDRLRLGETTLHFLVG